MIPPPFPLMERDTYSEGRLRNEVIYLHSLWHQGPPPPPHPLHHFLHPPPPPQPPHHHRHRLNPLTPPLFKTQRPSKRARDRKKARTQNSLQVSTSQWPCPPSPPPKSPVWPAFKPTRLPSNAHVHIPSPKLQSWAAGNRIQQRVVKEVTKFFNNQMDGSDDEDEDMDDDSGDEEGGENGGYCRFFLKLFVENEELRSFYEKNIEDGEFGCLVCGGVGNIRRFKDCVALVQHTQTISKTKTMKAHRAFGQVVCKVLGWDVNKLPSIISSIAGKKNETLSELEEDQRLMQEKISNEAGDVGSAHNESGEKEADGAEQLPDNFASEVAEEKLSNEAGDVASGDKESGEKEADGAEKLHDNCALSVGEAGPGSIDVGRDVDVCSVKEKGNSSTSDEKLPVTDISNLAQNLQSVSGVGRYANDQLEETLDGKQENAETHPNC